VSPRCCSRMACKRSPVYTLTYMYKESTAVLGPLAAYVDPHSWDLCEMHADRLVVPRGWDVVRLPKDPAQERAEDLEALANVVRDVPRPVAPPRPVVVEPVGQGVEVGRRGHLRVVRSAPAPQPET
jgi:hypothetical protein